MARTPAPWRYEASTKTIRSVPGNHWLASMNSWDGAVDHEANARVMAASAQMLKALKHLVHWHDQLSPTDIAMAQAAIAEAEGRADA